jgi:GntP family gluconate:H+ symporter
MIASWAGSLAGSARAAIGVLSLRLDDTAVKPWDSHDTRLIVVAVLGIALIVVLIAAAKMHPFLALTLGSGFVGIFTGVGLSKVVTNYEQGVGDTLKEVGLLIALGAMLGKLLAESGGADKIVDTLVSKAPTAAVPWAMALVAMIIGLPMFFEIGLVLLLPVIVLVARRTQLPLMRVAIPALAGLSILHGLVPPHPGPLIAIGFLGAQLGTTLAFGLLVAIPTVIICGPLFGFVAARWVPVAAPETAGGIGPDSAAGSGAAAAPGDGGRADDGHAAVATAGKAASPDVVRPPSFGITLATILFPVVLMLAKALADVIWYQAPVPSGQAAPPVPGVRVVLDFVGEPLVAMFLAVLLAMGTFGYAVGFSGKAINDRLGGSLAPIAGIILIVGAGGGFKQTLIGAGVGDTMAKVANTSGLSVLVIGYLIAVAIRLATGSATVATTTAAGILASPLLIGNLSSAHLALLALAIGAGSLFLSHVNDAGFWLVNQMFRLSVGQTFKTWSVMETLISVVAFGFIAVLWGIF